MTTPLLFAEDLSIGELRAEAWEEDSRAMFEAMSDIAEDKYWVEDEDVVVLDL